MDISTALAQLGVRSDSITDAEKATLDRDGFVKLERVLTPAQVEAVNNRMDELLREEGEAAGIEVHKEAGTDRLADLINKGEMFWPMFKEPRVLAAAAYVLQGDIRLSTLNSRAAQPGEGHQGLHRDGAGTLAPGRYASCNSLWLLDDFTPENGATRIVPRSHLLEKGPEVLADPKGPHPDQVQLFGKAGDVVVFNSSCWHGGTTNRTNKPRRCITAYYVRRDQPQLTDQRKFLRPETRQKLPAAALVLMDAV